MLGIEPRFAGRATNVLNHWAITPAVSFHFFWYCLWFGSHIWESFTKLSWFLSFTKAVFPMQSPATLCVVENYKVFSILCCSGIFMAFLSSIVWPHRTSVSSPLLICTCVLLSCSDGIDATINSPCNSLVQSNLKTAKFFFLMSEGI